MVSIWASYAISKKNRFHFYFVFSFEGFGWFTINLINTYFYGDDNDDFSSIHLQPGCKPFIKLYVNDKLAKESPTRKDKTLQDADISFETAKISKNSTIKLEIWDAGSFWFGKKSICCTGGDIDSFLNHPIRSNSKNSSKTISAEVMPFWRDEYK